jgi:hypothetical protein
MNRYNGPALIRQGGTVDVAVSRCWFDSRNTSLVDMPRWGGGFEDPGRLPLELADALLVLPEGETADILISSMVVDSMTGMTRGSFAGQRSGPPTL